MRRPTALDRLAVEAAPGVALIPAGDRRRRARAPPAAEAGAALAVALRDGPVPTLVDAGTGRRAPRPVRCSRCRTRRSSSCAAATSRCGARSATRRSPGPPGSSSSRSRAGRSAPRRSPTCSGRPVIARVPARDAIARAVDAGVLAHRLPDVLARPAATALRAVGLLWDQRGAAA